MGPRTEPNVGCHYCRSVACASREKRRIGKTADVVAYRGSGIQGRIHYSTAKGVYSYGEVEPVR